MKRVIFTALLSLFLVDILAYNGLGALCTKPDENCPNPTYSPNEGACFNGSHVTYVAAVLEYAPYNQWTQEGKGLTILRENANAYIDYARQAKNQSADILVTPEYGLQSDEMGRHSDSEEEFLTFTQYVPDPCLEIIPCSFDTDARDYFEVMNMLSCGARENDIYLVVNVAELYPCSNETIPDVPWDMTPSDDCPEEGYFVYNTEVVFDRRGAVIARYRKIHLYLEAGFTPGPTDDSTAIFLTDFNVAFSVHICFDIMYEDPANRNVKNYGIRDATLSTKWKDTLPFELADLIQNGWSRGLSSNLLASGYHNPADYALGSGIYRGYTRELPVYTFNKDSGSVLFVAPVTTIPVSNITHKCFGQKKKTSENSSSHDSNNGVLNSRLREGSSSHAINHQNLSDFTRVMLEKGQPGDVFNVSLCSNDEFCCNLTYEYHGNLTYYFIALSGLSPVGDGHYFLGVQQCGVVWCKTSDFSTCAYVEFGLPNSDSFGPFKISSLYMQSDFVFPVGSTREEYLIDNHNFEFRSFGNYYSITANVPVENLLTAALYGRWYSRDS